MGELALFIPILALSIPIVAIIAKHKHGLERMRLEHEAQGFGTMASAAAGRIERLEARVAVLERIATDGSGRLASEIDNLRTRG
jgi:hypothetical protein